MHQGTASSRGRGTRCWLCVLHRQGLFGSPSEAFIAKRMTNKLDETFEMQQSLGACPAAPGDKANADASEVDPAPLGLHLLGGDAVQGRAGHRDIELSGLWETPALGIRGERPKRRAVRVL